MEYKLQKAILHTSGKDADNEMEKYSQEEREIMQQYMAAWDGVHVTVSNFLDGEYSVVGWPPEWDEKAKEAIYLMEQDPTFGKYVDDREQFEKDWAAGAWEPGGSIVFSPDMVEIIGDLKKAGEKSAEE